MRVAAVQHDIAWEDPEANFSHLAPMVTYAVSEGADLVVLTEMFSTGFSLSAERIAEPFVGPSVEWLCSQAAQHDCWIAGSVPTLDIPGELPVNRFVVAAPDGAIHHYDKLYPFSYAGEHERYRAGKNRMTIEIMGVRTSLFVCYDLRFADAFWDLAHETDLYLVPANWPESRREHWQTLLRARAIENQAYVLGVNRVGDDPKLSYSGDSLIVDPFGEVLAQADPGWEGVLFAEVDRRRVDKIRTDYPFLKDRRG